MAYVCRYCRETHQNIRTSCAVAVSMVLAELVVCFCMEDERDIMFLLGIEEEEDDEWIRTTYGEYLERQASNLVPMVAKRVLMDIVKGVSDG